jgi:hypothetical protein
MSTFAADAGFQPVCYHAAGSIFTIGVIEETALNAAIPSENGRTSRIQPDHSNSKNAL